MIHIHNAGFVVEQDEEKGTWKLIFHVGPSFITNKRYPLLEANSEKELADKINAGLNNTLTAGAVYAAGLTG